MKERIPMISNYRRYTLIIITVSVFQLNACPAKTDENNVKAATLTSSPATLPSNLTAKKKVELKKYFPTKQLEKGEEVKWTHAPYNVGKCSLCHESDDVKKPGPMRASVNTICLTCHKREKTYIKNHKVVHEPVSKDCGYCHNAHNAANRSLLYKPMAELCTTCHVDQKKEFSARTQHEPVTKQKQCENCHDSHATNYEKLLKNDEASLCMDCHGGRETSVKDRNGQVLVNIKAVSNRKYKHEPFGKGHCSDCHNSHGSPYFRLLKAPLPEDFYAPYKDEAYGLCYECHDKKRITTAKTTTLTGFRDGDKNLHYVHVVKPTEGRTCRACHDDHATAGPHLIRASVPYGPSGWELPITYTESPKGGRCSKTCHDDKTYNNNGVRPKDLAAAYKARKAREEKEKTVK
jgi:predicted CXXCH cytochrome family protein